MIYYKSSHWIKRDKDIRKFFVLSEINKILLKSLLYNELGEYKHKMYYDWTFKKYKKNSSLCRYRTSCVILANTRSVLRRFKLSRHAAKKYASYGIITGLKKAPF